MVAIAAAAHALDGLYGTVKPLVKPRFTKAARHRQIIETLKLGFRVASRADAWAGELEWLFGVRDSIVHHADEYRPLRVSRETLRTVVLGGAEQLQLSAESALRAASVAEFCIAHPKPATQSWSGGRANWEPGPGGLITPDDIEKWVFPLR